MADYFAEKGWNVHFLVNDNEFSKKTVVKYSNAGLCFKSLKDEIYATERFLARTAFDVIVVDFVKKNQDPDLMNVFARHAERAVVAITDDFNPVAINADILVACHPNQTALRASTTWPLPS